MLITGSGVVNRYIAAQGPLPETSADFWQMVWEQRSSLVVMLTTITERGRVKCHQYWPDLDTTVRYGDIAVTCTKEEKTASFEFRDFVISQSTTKARLASSRSIFLVIVNFIVECYSYIFKE